MSQVKKAQSTSVQLNVVKDGKGDGSKSYRAVQMTVEEAPVIVPAAQTNKPVELKASEPKPAESKSPRAKSPRSVKKSATSSAEREKKKRDAVRRVKSSATVKKAEVTSNDLKRNKSFEDKKELEEKEKAAKEAKEKKEKESEAKKSKGKKHKSKKDVPLANRITYENGANEKTSLVVYWAPNSPSPNIVVLFLQVARIPYKSIQFQWQDTASRENRVDKSYYKLNPNRSIPTIVDGDFVLFESHTIIRYLAEKYCETAPQWYPTDPIARAKIDNALEWNLTHLRATWLSILHSIMGQRPELASDYWGSNQGIFEDTPNGAISTFARFEREWLSQGDYIAGLSAPSVADIAMFADFSFSYTLLHLDHALTPELYPALHAWNFRMRKYLKPIPQYLVYSGIQNALAAYFPSPPEMPLEPKLPWHDYVFPGVTEEYRDIVSNSLGSSEPWPTPTKKDKEPISNEKPTEEAPTKEEKSIDSPSTPKKHISKSKTSSHHKTKSGRHTPKKSEDSADSPKTPKRTEKETVDDSAKKAEKETVDDFAKKEQEATAKALKKLNEEKQREEEEEKLKKQKEEEEALMKKQEEEETAALKQKKEEEEAAALKKKLEEEEELKLKKKKEEEERKKESSSSSSDSDESPSPRKSEIVNLSDKPIDSPKSAQRTSESSSDDEDEEELKAQKEEEERKKLEQKEQKKKEEEIKAQEEEERKKEEKAKEEEELKLKLKKQKEDEEAALKKKQEDEEALKKQKEKEEEENKAKKQKEEEELKLKKQKDEEQRKKQQEEQLKLKKQKEDEERKKKEKEEEELKLKKQKERRAAEENMSDADREAMRLEKLMAKKKADQQARQDGLRSTPSSNKIVVSPAVSLTNTLSAPAAPKPEPPKEPSPPSSDSESSSDDEDDPEPPTSNFLEHAKWEDRENQRENLRERKRIEKDMKKRGLAIPAFKPKQRSDSEFPNKEISPIKEKPQFKDLVEEAKWEEEQRSKQIEEERRGLSTPTKPAAQKNFGFQGMSPIVPRAQKPATPNSTRGGDNTKTTGIAAKLKAMREQEEARLKAQKEAKEAEAKKKKETEEAWKAKQQELAKQNQKERESQQPKATEQPKVEVVSSAPLNPMEELERIRKEAAENGSDTYFGQPKA